MPRAVRLVTATLLIAGAFVLAGCSATPAPPAVDPSTIEIADCPQALVDSFAESDQHLVDASNVAALDAVDGVEPSCVFEGKDLADESFYWVYYVTDTPTDVIAYLTSGYAAIDVRSQEESTTGGTWDVGDVNVGAEIGTADNDSSTFALIDGPYVWMFVA